MNKFYLKIVFKKFQNQNSEILLYNFQKFFKISVKLYNWINFI